MNKNIRQTVLPILAALIWGTAFAYQDKASDFVQPFTFNFTRSIVAVVFLALLVFAVDTFKTKKLKIKVETDYKKLIIGGLCCGLCLFVAVNLQQLGIDRGTSGDKAGFITAIYMVIIPIVEIFMKKRVSWTIWISVVLAMFGLYLLCITDGFKVQVSDVYIFLCAIVFAGHIMVIDYFTKYIDGIKLSLIQFFVVMVLSGICSFIFEQGSILQVKNCIWAILFCGLLSSGVAYTLQIVAQKGTNPVVVSLLLSLESFFAMVAEAIILQHRLTVREYIGCAIILVAVLLTQIKFEKKKPIEENSENKNA